MTTYGYIGLGQMGAAMAANLIETGATVTVHDLDRAAVAAAVALGAVGVDSSAEVAAASDIISICVPAAHHVEAVVHGPGGIADAGRAGQTILIHSTVLPETVLEARDVAAQWGGVVFDACVAGGAEAARRGEVVVLAGGVTEMAPDVVALLATYGSKLIDGGPVGAGAALKLGVNIMTYAQFAAAASAFDVAANTNTDTAALVEAWRHIGQLGALTESFATLLAVPAEHVVGSLLDGLRSTLVLAEKDLELAAELSTGDTDKRRLLEALHAAMPETFRVR